MKFTALSILFVLSAGNISLVSARSPRKLSSKGSKRKSNNYGTNHASSHHTVIVDPIENRFGDEVDSSSVPVVQCNECTDEASPWMSFHSKQCATWSLTAESCAVKTLYWQNNGFCQASCAKLGYPYAGTNCCKSMLQVSIIPPTSPPTPSPSGSPIEAKVDSTNRSDNDCVVCDDRQTPYMIGNNKECPTWNFVSTICREKTTYWERNRFCRLTCSNLGYPYEGDDDVVCCGVSPNPNDEPSVIPSLSPSALPSSSPSTVPSASPTSTPSAQPSSKPSALPSNMPSTLPSSFPSAFPSMRPSTSPSTGPSSNPSASPTDAVAPDTKNDDCVPCTNVPSIGMSGRGLTCDSWHKVEDRCYDKRTGWINNQYCELGCYIAGFPYDHAKKCCLDVTPRNNIVPTPSPSPKPSRMPSPAPTSKPTPPEINSDNNNCVKCNDKRTPWMVMNDKYCDSWSLVPYRCTEKSLYYNFWSQEKFCQQSCFDAGHPYPGDVCCPPTPAPTTAPTSGPTHQHSEEPSYVPTARPSTVPSQAPSPFPTAHPSPVPTSRPTPSRVEPDNRSCIECHDKRTPYMVANNKYCDSWGLIPYRCTEQSSVYDFWSQEKFCQQSCFDAGHAYPGDVCCPPTPGPTPVPTPLPTTDPSEEGNCFAYARDCGADNPCADPNACCSAWGHCGYGQEWCGACCQGGNCNDSDDSLRFLRGSGNTFLINNMTDASFDVN